MYIYIYIAIRYYSVVDYVHERIFMFLSASLESAGGRFDSLRGFLGREGSRRKFDPQQCPDSMDSMDSMGAEMPCYPPNCKG